MYGNAAAGRCHSVSAEAPGAHRATLLPADGYGQHAAFERAEGHAVAGGWIRSACRLRTHTVPRCRPTVDTVTRFRAHRPLLPAANLECTCVVCENKIRQRVLLRVCAWNHRRQKSNATSAKRGYRGHNAMRLCSRKRRSANGDHRERACAHVYVSLYSTATLARARMYVFDGHPCQLTRNGSAQRRPTRLLLSVLSE